MESTPRSCLQRALSGWAVNATTFRLMTRENRSTARTTPALFPINPFTPASDHQPAFKPSPPILTWKKGLIILHGPHHVAEKSTTTSLSPAAARASWKASWGGRRNTLSVTDFHFSFRTWPGVTHAFKTQYSLRRQRWVGGSLEVGTTWSTLASFRPASEIPPPSGTPKTSKQQTNTEMWRTIQEFLLLGLAFHSKEPCTLLTQDELTKYHELTNLGQRPAPGLHPQHETPSHQHSTNKKEAGIRTKAGFTLNLVPC